MVNYYFLDHHAAGVDGAGRGADEDEAGDAAMLDLERAAEHDDALLDTTQVGTLRINKRSISIYLNIF